MTNDECRISKEEILFILKGSGFRTAAGQNIGRSDHKETNEHRITPRRETPNHAKA